MLWGFPVMPKMHELYCGLKDIKSDRYYVSKRQIEVPDFCKNRLDLGSLILTECIENIVVVFKETSSFNFGQIIVYSKEEKVIIKSDTLNILYQIYNSKTKTIKLRYYKRYP